MTVVTSTDVMHGVMVNSSSSRFLEAKLSKQWNIIRDLNQMIRDHFNKIDTEKINDQFSSYVFPSLGGNMCFSRW